MTVRDLIVISSGNMWRMKLRAILTTAGILIAIATFIAMLSFGAGNEKYLEEEFNKLGLFTTMQVYPKDRSRGLEFDRPRGRQSERPRPQEGDSSRKLDGAAIEALAAVPGVNLVYPYDAFSVKVSYRDSTVDSRAQALPSSAVRTKAFSKLLAGKVFSGDTSRSVLISERLMRSLGFSQADSAIGRRIAVSIRVSQIDSGLVHILSDQGVSIIDRLKKIHFDSLLNSAYRSKVIRTETNEALRRFMNGFTRAQEVIADTLVVCGVRGADNVGRLRIEPVIIPFATAARFSSTGFAGGPMEILNAAMSGNLFSRGETSGAKTFPQVTIDYDPKVMYKTIRDSVEKLGFRAFSFAEEFEQIQRVFVYFDLALGVLGLIALLTASLGIINTMVMSITERRREIGILKSLGADEGDIHRLFLFESGVFGFMGTAGGVLTGWTATRIISAVAQAYMRNEGFPAVELFALPVWLILIAFAVGVGVSVLAGLYPAARAARVDPVEALRND